MVLETLVFKYGCDDIGIGKVVFGTDETIVNIDNIGNYPLPVVLTVKYKDGMEKSIKKEINIWRFGKTVSISIPKGELKENHLNNAFFQESNYSDNKIVY